MARGGTSEQAAKTRYRDVFAVAEFRALWLAQLLSIIGDQFARVALTVLVFDRTRSALLAAVTFVVSVVPTFIGGIALAWLADRHPRRAVMIVCDLIRCALVLLMVVPGVPLAAMVTLLFVVTLAGAPFNSARAAIYPEVLTGERYVLGTAIGLTTVQFAQVVGFALGGTIAGFFGTRTSLVIDGATFALSGLIVQSRVRPRPAPAARRGDRGERREGPAGLAGVLAGTRLVFANRVLRTTMLSGWLAAFYSAPEGVVTPLARDLGGGTLAVGVILAAQALGTTSGVLAFSRLVPPPARLGYMGPLSFATCAVLVLFVWRPDLPVSLLVLFVSGLGSSYQLAANAGFVGATPAGQRSQAFGLAQGGISLGEGIVLITAGAAADRHSPALVIAACGAVGAVLAVVLALSWRQGRRRVSGRHERALGPLGAAHRVLLPVAAVWVCILSSRSTGCRACHAPFSWSPW